MAAEPVLNPGGVGQGTRPPGVNDGENPTADMAADQTLDFTPSPVARQDSASLTAVTVSLPAAAVGTAQDLDELDRTASWEPGGMAVGSGTPATRDPAIHTIGPYDVLRELGRGGMG